MLWARRIAGIQNILQLLSVRDVWSVQEDCLDAGQVLPILYYHQPFSCVLEKKPLSGCCISLSNYFGKEKAYLIELLGELGANYQDVFARVSKLDKGKAPYQSQPCRLF